MNLFDGYSNAEKEDLIDQIAFMRSVKFTNILKTKANKTKEKITGLFNKFSDKISNKVDSDSILNYDFRFQKKEIKEISDYLFEERKKLENKSKDAIEILLKKELISRIDSDKFNDQFPHLIDEKELSKEIIENAAKWKELKIDDPENTDYKTKANLIATQFANILKQKTKKVLQDMNKEEKKESDKLMNNQINNMSDEKKEAIKEALEIDDLSGEVLRKTLIGSGSTLAAISTVQLSGIGAYIALTTVMNAVFTTMLGITIPFGVYTTATSGLALLAGPIGWLLVLGFGGRQFFKGKQSINIILLVQAVWFSYNHLDYDLKEDPLPDWLPDRKKNKIKQLSKQTTELSQYIMKIKNEKEKIANELSKKENLEEKYRKEYELKRKNLEKNNKRIEKLNKKIEKIKTKKEEELDNYVDMASEEISSYQKEIEELNRKNNKIKNEKLNKENKLNKIKKEKQKLKEKNKRLATKLSGRITGMLDYFGIFTYDNKAKKDISKLDHTKIKKFMNRLVKLIENHYRQNNIHIKRTLTDIKSENIIELKYGYQGRIYLIDKGNEYHICRVGDKNSQNRDINWIKSKFS